MNRWQHVSFVVSRAFAHRRQTVCWGLVGLLSLSSCSPGANPGTIASTNEGRITVGTTQKPRTLDPADAYELRSIALIRNLSDRLYTYDPGSTVLKPQLATALPTVSPDGLTTRNETLKTPSHMTVWAQR